MKFDATGLEGYVTDKEVESTVGVWLPPFPGERRFRVLRAGGSNHKFARAFQQAIKPHRRQMDKGTLDTETTDAIMREVYAKHIVIDWEGIKDENGVAVPCTPENVQAFFVAFPEIFGDVISYATEMATFSIENLEEAQDVLGEN